MLRKLSWLALLSIVFVACDDHTPVEPGSDARESILAGARTQGTADISVASSFPIEYFRDTLEIAQEGTGLNSLLAVDGSEDDPPASFFNLVRIARVPAPIAMQPGDEGQKNTVQANDILIDDANNRAYVAYNYQGTPSIGGIQVLDISNPDLPTAVYVVEFPGADINAVGLDGGDLLITGALDPVIYSDLVEEGKVAFATFGDANASDEDALAAELRDNMVLLPSYAGTGIAAQGGNIYVGTGDAGGVIATLDGSFVPGDDYDYPDVRDLDAYGNGIIAVMGSAGGGTAGVLVGDPSTSPPLLSVGTFGDPTHKGTVEVYHGSQGDLAFLGLSSEGFKVLDLGGGGIVGSMANPPANVGAQQTNTNSVSTNGDFIVTANGEYGFRLLMPAEEDFSAFDVIGYFQSELAPPAALEDRFSVNHVAIDENDCLYAAAGAWGVYIYCIVESPAITVSKTADPNVIDWTSGGLGEFDPDITFTETGDGLPDDELFFGTLTCDDEGPDDEPEQVDFNCMGRADNIENVLGLRWSWDATDQWRGNGQTGDGCALLDSDGDGNANFAVCVRIENDPDTGELIHLGLPGGLDLYTCGNSKVDRCTQQHELQEDEGGSECSIALADDAFPGRANTNNDDQVNDVEATCAIDLTLEIFGGVDQISLLNVCAFPSGAPNSNAFDCVVTPGSAFIRIAKVVESGYEELFGFTMSPAATDGSDEFAVLTGVTSALIPVDPDSDYSLTELAMAGWALDGATCDLNGESTGTLDGLQVGSIGVSTGQTTVCTFTNRQTAGSDVTYTIVVTNVSLLEDVTITSLSDDSFEDIGECALGVGTVLAANGGSFTCSWTETEFFKDRAPGFSHTNTFTAVAVSDDQAESEDSDDETVSVVDATEDEQQ